jgi:hypothetical protein
MMSKPKKSEEEEEEEKYSLNKQLPLPFGQRECEE